MHQKIHLNELLIVRQTHQQSHLFRPAGQTSVMWLSSKRGAEAGERRPVKQEPSGKAWPAEF